MIDIRKRVAAILLAASVGGWLGAAAAQAQTLKVAMGSDVKIVDPIWTTAYISRNTATWSTTRCSHGREARDQAANG